MYQQFCNQFFRFAWFLYDAGSFIMETRPLLHTFNDLIASNQSDFNQFSPSSKTNSFYLWPMKYVNYIITGTKKEIYS